MWVDGGVICGVGACFVMVVSMLFVSIRGENLFVLL